MLVGLVSNKHADSECTDNKRLWINDSDGFRILKTLKNIRSKMGCMNWFTSELMEDADVWRLCCRLSFPTTIVLHELITPWAGCCLKSRNVGHQ